MSGETIKGVRDMACYVMGRSDCLQCLDSWLFEEDKEVRRGLAKNVEGISASNFRRVGRGEEMKNETSSEPMA